VEQRFQGQRSLPENLSFWPQSESWMEALINRTANPMLLAVIAVSLLGGTETYAQSEDPVEPDERDEVAMLPPGPRDEPAILLEEESAVQEEQDDATMLPPGPRDEPAILLEEDSAVQEEQGPNDPDLEARMSAQQQLAEDFSLYKNLLENGMTAEADVVAKRIVELSIRENGFESADTARALTNLAIVQHKNEDYETAQQNYEAAIGIIERVEDRLSSGLINPLRGLGAAQLAAGRPDLALESFGRARHVSHVNEGPHNLDQVNIIEALAEIYIHIGEYERAYELQDRIYALYARRYSTDSDEIIPALYKRAEWQHRLRLYGRERDTYRRIIKIIENNDGKDDLKLIKPLTGLGNAYLYVGDADSTYHRDGTMTTGEIFVKRAKRIAESNPDATWQIREDAYLSLGDFYIFSDKSGKASRTYKETWNLLSEDDERLANRYDHLETLVLLQGIYPPKYYGIDEDDEPPGDDVTLLEGKVVTKFTVDTRGRARDYEIIEADPAGLEEMERDVLREMRRLVYRPRMEGGEVVDTNDLIYTHEFFYREKDLPSYEEEEQDTTDEEPDEEVADATN
jgi:tetratricopeptide (TPR) repeat protein